MKDKDGVFHYDVLFLKIFFAVLLLVLLILNLGGELKNNIITILVFSAYIVWIKSDVYSILEEKRKLRKDKKEKK